MYDQGIVTAGAPNAPVPWLRCLSYREGLIAGLTWIYGITVRAPDGSDPGMCGRWLLTVPSGSGAGRPIPVTVTMEQRAQGGSFDVRASAPGRAVELATIPAQGRGLPLDRGADLALTGLPRLVEATFGPQLEPRQGVRSAALKPWAPGGLVEFADAILPLDRPPPEVSPAELARGARALAWQSLLDSRMAPSLAIHRAAQALALAAVAERLAGQPLPEAAVARWLAPAAPLSDFWLLASTPPPPGWPELIPLHRAYAVPDVPWSCPSEFALPDLVENVERARSIRARSACARLSDWAALRRVSGAYLASTSDFAPMRNIGRMAIDAPLEGVVGLGAVLMPLASRLPSGTQRLLAWAEYEKVQRHGSHPGEPGEFGRIVDLARGLWNAASLTEHRALKLLLQDSAERVLHGLCHVDQRLGQMAAPDVRMDLLNALSARRVWAHPELQRQALRGMVRYDERSRAQSIVVEHVVTHPGTLHEHLDGLPDWKVVECLLRQLGHFTDHPAAVARSAAGCVAFSRPGLALGLIRWLVRTQGYDRTPLYGRLMALIGGPCARELAGKAPPVWKTIPTLLKNLPGLDAWGGDRRPALVALRRAFDMDPSSVEVVEELVDRMLRARMGQEACQVVERFLKVDSHSDAARTICYQLVSGLMTLRMSQEAMHWSQQMASTRHGLAELAHARTAAFSGKLPVAREALNGALRSGVSDPGIGVTRAVISIVESGGKSGWDELESRWPHLDDAARMEFVTRFAEAGIACSGSPWGGRLKSLHALQKLVERASQGPVELSSVVALVDDVLRLSPLDQHPLTVLSSRLGRLIGAVVYGAIVAKTAERLDRAGLGRLLYFGRECPGSRIATALDWMGRYGARPDQLVQAAAVLQGALPARARVFLAPSARRPEAIEDWITIFAHGLDDGEAAIEYLTFLWLSGRDAEVCEYAESLVRFADLEAASFSLAASTLASLAGSPDRYAAWLGSCQLPADRLASWRRKALDQPDDVFWTTLARFRPDDGGQPALQPARSKARGSMPDVVGEAARGATGIDEPAPPTDRLQWFDCTLEVQDDRTLQVEVQVDCDLGSMPTGAVQLYLQNDRYGVLDMSDDRGRSGVVVRDTSAGRHRLALRACATLPVGLETVQLWTALFPEGVHNSNNVVRHDARLWRRDGKLVATLVRVRR